jgi:hypothetical protein
LTLCSLKPLLVIVGSNAGSRWASEEHYQLAKGPKERFIGAGGTDTRYTTGMQVSHAEVNRNFR